MWSGFKSRLTQKLQKMLFAMMFPQRYNFKYRHETASIKHDVSISNPQQISLAKNVRLNNGVVLQPGYWEISIGENSLINQYSCVYGHVIIGSHVMVAPHVMFAGGYHNISRTDIPMMSQGDGSKGPILIGDDVWIGANAVILDGVSIGNGAVIGAGAVVTKDIPPFGIAYGNPAVVVKSRK